MDTQNKDWIQSARLAIETAKSLGNQEEIATAVHVLRDLEATSLAGLREIAWDAHRYGITKRELDWFIGFLEDFLAKYQANQTKPITV